MSEQGLAEKLRKIDFDSQNHFRRSREDSPVNCSSCNYMSGVPKGKGEAFCEHPERARKVQLTETWGFTARDKNSITYKSLCDRFESRDPLPKGVEVPDLPEGHAILLSSQFADLYHGDSKCPYVIEELKLIQNGTRTAKYNRAGEIRIADMSDMVAGEVISDICDMPCCESKLPYQISHSEYRRRWGLKPDGSEPRVWVRNNITKHGGEVKMPPEEIDAFFDLTNFQHVGDKEKLRSHLVHHQIGEAMDHLWDKSNMLGSRPLSEAANPVRFSNQHKILGGLKLNSEKHLEIWAYDQRLFDYKNLQQSMREGNIRNLENIPEGFVLCVDTNDVIDRRLTCREFDQSSFWVYGAVKPLEDQSLTSKGLSHFIEIGALTYHDSNAFMGVYGKGFGAVARFDEQ